eukprot:685208-Pyramimonas_sp.AAC.1
MRAVAVGFSVELPRGHETLHWVVRTHAGGSSEAFGGAPSGVTKRWVGWWGRLRAVALGPSVEFPLGPWNV